MILGVLFAAFEWVYLPNEEFLKFGYSVAIPSYPKVSVVLISCAVFGLFLKIKKTPSKFTEYLAKLSLYVYCIHQIVIKIVSYLAMPSIASYLIVAVATYLLSSFVMFLVNTLKAHFKT